MAVANPSKVTNDGGLQGHLFGFGSKVAGGSGVFLLSLGIKRISSTHTEVQNGPSFHRFNRGCPVPLHPWRGSLQVPLWIPSYKRRNKFCMVRAPQDVSRQGGPSRDPTSYATNTKSLCNNLTRTIWEKNDLNLLCCSWETPL